ncbi:MAG: hypothetical protein ACPGLV_17760, partial [Bacteroidia bacterium]
MFFEPGSYKVCLYVENTKGNDSKCVENNIIVRNEQLFCDERYTEELHGRLLDTGNKGPTGGIYECNYHIKTCQKEIVLYFSDFELVQNGKCYLQIFKGSSDKTGVPVHDYLPKFDKGLTGDISQNGFKDSLIIDHHEVYLKLIIDSKSAASRGVDLNWHARGEWEGDAPNIDFALADTICIETPLYAEPDLTGDILNFHWEISSDVSNPLIVPTTTLNERLFFPGIYQIKAVASNCKVSDSISKQIFVREPSGPLTIKMGISNKNPNHNEIIQLMDSSFVDNYECGMFTQWQISPLSYTVHGNSTLNSRVIDISFNDSICYDIKLISR